MKNINEIKLPFFLTDIKSEGGITGSTLKIIAVVTMLIDHIAAVVLDGYLQSAGYGLYKGINIYTELQSSPFYGGILLIDLIMRLIGRLSFPIFCFLLSEGFIHTHSRFKYALRLLVFAVLSELPFDLALGYEKGIIGFVYQNIFFTLFIGLMTIWGMERFQEKTALMLLVICAGILSAELLRVDYGGIGILTIIIIHTLRKKSNALSMFAGCVVHTLFNFNEITSLFNLYFIRRYNGERGLKLKYVFYLFYPVHLFILYLIKRLVTS